MFGKICQEIQDFQWLLPGFPQVTVSFTQHYMKVLAHWEEREVKDVYVLIDKSKLGNFTWELFVDEFLTYFATKYAEQKKAYQKELAALPKLTTDDIADLGNWQTDLKESLAKAKSELLKGLNNHD